MCPESDFSEREYISGLKMSLDTFLTVIRYVD
jgi:hypothetical protein